MTTWATRRALVGSIAAGAGIVAFSNASRFWQDNAQRGQPAPHGGPSDFTDTQWLAILNSAAHGVSLAGLEFGEHVFPGRLNAEAQPPPVGRYGYYRAAGMRSVRLPYLWERFQPELFGDIDGELGLLSSDRHLGKVLFKDVVRQQLDLAHQHGLKVLLDPHNYGARALFSAGRWRTEGGTGRQGRFAIGSPEVPVAAFADFVGKLAAEFGSHPALLGLDIMNEPVALPKGSESWVEAAQAAITAVRKVDRDVLLFIEGYQYANAHIWPKLNPELHNLRDPAGRVVFSAHLYFDHDHSGRYTGAEAVSPRPGADPQRPVRDIRPFLDWLDTHRFRGHVGEFGIPDHSEWQPFADAFLAECGRRGVLLHAWADWPKPTDYVLQLNPQGGSERQLVRKLGTLSRERTAR